ncbi:MAG: iron-sulfur cluster assembly scaffold protein [Proteobacteria bacterium]|nr:iron-sulfur cluster assembly scaffold protein [Pseudomonadota bacterium]
MSATAGRAERLYTPQVLALATVLASYPLTADLPLAGEARSASCGSRLRLGLALDGAGRIARIGVAAQACAVGQAAAGLFAQGAVGRDAAAIALARRQLEQWLAGDAALPDWPGLEAISAAQAFPARHGAVMLAWRAAEAALSQAAGTG